MYGLYENKTAETARTPFTQWSQTYRDSVKCVTYRTDYYKRLFHISDKQYTINARTWVSTANNIMAKLASDSLELIDMALKVISLRLSKCPSLSTTTENVWKLIA